MIKAVVFDLDNTLYDYDTCDKFAMFELKRYCMDLFQIGEDEFAQKYSLAKEITKKRLGTVAASHNRMLYAQTFLELQNEKPASHALELYDIYWDAMLSHMKPYRYVRPLFGQLADRGIKIAVLTDLTVHIQHRKIQKLAIDGYVDVLVTSEEAGKEKPDPAMFELLTEKLNLRAHQLLMIGDDLKKDIAGAKAADVPAVLFTRNKADTMHQECMKIMKDQGSGK